MKNILLSVSGNRTNNSTIWVFIQSLDQSICSSQDYNAKLYLKVILRKWHLKFLDDFVLRIDDVVDCLYMYTGSAFNGHPTGTCVT